MYSQANTYKKNQIHTASSEYLVLMLYDGAKKFIRKAICFIDNQDIQGANQNLLRAQQIMSELMSGINFTAGPIASDLYALYEYMRYRLIQANLKKDRHCAEEVLGMVDELREAWVQIIKPGQAEESNHLEAKKMLIS